MTRPRSVAPNYDVPENASPFVPLPILTRCSSCGEPQDPLSLWSAVRDGKMARDLCQKCAHIDPDAPMCQCGHTRESHDVDLLCFGCSGPTCDAPGVTVKMTEYQATWRWNLRCARHGSLEVRGVRDDWEPDAVTRFRLEHAGHDA